MNRRDILKLLGLTPIFPSMLVMQEEKVKMTLCHRGLNPPKTHELECRLIKPDRFEIIPYKGCPPFSAETIPGVFSVIATYRQPVQHEYPSPDDNKWWTETEYTWRYFYLGVKQLENVEKTAAWLEHKDNLVEWCEKLTIGPTEQWPRETRTGGIDGVTVPVCVLCDGKIRLKPEGSNFRSFRWPEKGIQIKTGGKDVEPCRRI